METVLHSPDITKNYAPITIHQGFTVTAFKPPKVAMESAVLLDGRAIIHGTSRYRMLNRYRIASGAVSIIWIFASVAALASGINPEAFFALFFSTFGLYLVFALKCRES